MTTQEFKKALGVGVATAVLLSLVIIPATWLGISPLPEALDRALGEARLGLLPLPVGFLSHLAYVTFWSVVYVVFFRERLTLLNALWFALVLWLSLLVLFIPLVERGVGLGGDPVRIFTALGIHIAFAVIVSALSQRVFNERRMTSI